MLLVLECRLRQSTERVPVVPGVRGDRAERGAAGVKGKVTFR